MNSCYFNHPKQRRTSQAPSSSQPLAFVDNPQHVPLQGGHFSRRVRRRITQDNISFEAPPIPSDPDDGPAVLSDAAPEINPDNSNSPPTVAPASAPGGVTSMEPADVSSHLGRRQWIRSSTNMEVDSIPNQDRFMGHLYRLCDQAGASKTLCDDLLDAIKDFSHRGFNLNSNTVTRRHAFLPKMQKKLGLLPPEAIPITLESGETVTVYRFHYIDFLKEHLISDVFSKVTNIDLPNPNDPWSLIPSADRDLTYDSPTSSLWYKEYVSQMEQQIEDLHDHWMIHPLTLYIDKTGADGIMKNTIEPLVCTSSLLSQSSRQDTRNWFIGGLMPNLEHSSSAKRRGKKTQVRDYHRCLRVLLDPLIKLQQERPAIWFRRGNQTSLLRGLFPVLTIMGDNLSSNKICGRINNTGPTSPRMCRRCLTPFSETDTIPHHCLPINSKAIQKLSSAALGCDYGLADTHPAPASANYQAWTNFLNSQNSKSEKQVLERLFALRKKVSTGVLKNIYGCHLVDNAFNEVDFGPNGSVERATVSDIMHSFEEGIVKYLLDIVIGMMTDTQKAGVDSLVENMFSSLNSNRSGERPHYPRVSFTRGFCSLSLLSADERMGQLFVLSLLMRTAKGKTLMSDRFHLNFDQKRAEYASKRKKK